MKLFVYDHCPFCVKARAILGIKRIPFELVILLNDDEATPTRMIGKKMAPILEHEGRFIPESMDIVAYVDGLAPGNVLTGPCNPGIEEWISQASDALFRLALPRWADSSMREFATPEARAYFTRKKEAVIGSFKERTAESDEYIAVLNGLLPTMNEMIQSADNVNGDELSEDDIHLFAALRAMSIVKGIDYPPAVEAYRFRMAERTSIDLHDDIAT